MRIRNLVLIGLFIVLVGSGAWFFARGTSGNTAGAGGLPLIKADINPVKLPPEEPGGEIMSNADSTVFSAMGEENNDPSMEHVKPPAPDTSAKAEDGSFAGLKTGFAVPAEPEKKAESLFGNTNQYVSGIAETPGSVKEQPAQEAPPQPTPIVQVPADVTPAAEEKAESKKEILVGKDTQTQNKQLEESTLPPVAQQGDNVAQNMEAEEKSFIRPVSKPPVPEAVQKKPEPKTADDVIDKLAASEPAVSTTTAPKTAQKPEKASAGKAFYIQLASAPGNGDASGIWEKLQSKYTGALDGLEPAYQKVTVAGKGDYVRIQAGPMSETQARARCTTLHAIDPKGGCLVLRR